MKGKLYFLAQMGAVLLMLGGGGCSQYAVNLNGRNLYQPPKLFSDFVVSDPGLSRCIKEVIYRRKIIEAEGLVNLECPYSSIRSADGLEVFRRLQILDLSHNQLVDGKGLTQLSELRQLNVDGNPSFPCNAVKTLREKGVALIGVRCMSR